MSTIPCVSSGCAATGGIICAHCGWPYCFDHCVGHGCPYAGPRPTQHVGVEDAHSPDHLWHPWLWSRLHTALHALGSLSLPDTGHVRHVTLFAPSPSASHPWYYYQVTGVNQSPFTSAPAESLEALIQAMELADHHRLFFRVLGMQVEQWRAEATHRAGQPVRADDPAVIRAEIRRQRQIAEKPTIFINTKEAS
jgi:hypothetical protein